MKNRFYFWGVLSPDNKLITSTLSPHKLIANLKASKLCRQQLGLRWRNVRKEQNYKMIKVECRIVNNGSDHQTETNKQ